MSDLDLNCNFDSQGRSMEEKTWFEVQRDSDFAKAIKAIEFFNLLYIAFMIPFSLAFDYPMNAGAIAFESVSLCLQAIFIVSKFRTSIIVQGRSTLDFKHVLKSYLREGLVVDLFGLLPLNLILGIVCPLDKDSHMRTVLVVSAFRLLRVISIWRMFELIDELTVYLKSASYYIILIKAAAIWFIIGHLMVCAWYYVVAIVERDRTKDTWAIQQELPSKNRAEKYLRSYYFMLNVATGIGSGDMFPSNELERFVISCLMTTGDVLWSFGFGLIVFFWDLKQSTNNKKVDLESKINALQ